MRKTARKHIVIVIIAFVGWGCARSTDDSAGSWKGSAVEEDGILVVENAGPPLHGEFIWDLEEDLVIGGDDENTLFVNAYRLAIDEEDNIYVMDAGNSRIQKFDKAGNFLASIGREGQGPGEFSRLNNLALNASGNLFAADGQRLQEFNSTGEFIKSTALPSSTRFFHVTPASGITCVITADTDAGQVQRIVNFDAEGRELETIAEFASVNRVTREEGGARRSLRVRHAYNPALTVTSTGSGGFIYAYSAEYSLHKFNADGSPALIIRKEESPFPISASEKAAIIQDIKDRFFRGQNQWPDDAIEEACQFPAFRPFYFQPLVDDLDRIYIRKQGSILEDDGRTECDIFSPDGYFLYRTVFPGIPSAISRGYLYRFHEDPETGDISLIRYRVKNWNDIKIGM